MKLLSAAVFVSMETHTTTIKFCFATSATSLCTSFATEFERFLKVIGCAARVAAAGPRKRASCAPKEEVRSNRRWMVVGRIFFARSGFQSSSFKMSTRWSQLMRRVCSVTERT